MGDMGEFYRDWKEHKRKHRSAETEKRFQYVKSQLEKFAVSISESSDFLQIMIKGGKKITFYPYSGWFQGAGKSGRGIENLVSTIKKMDD